MAYRLSGTRIISEGDQEQCAVNCTQYLDAGDTITGVVGSLAEGSGVTIDNAGPNGAEMSIENEPVAIGKAATWEVNGQSAGTRFVVALQITTNAGRVFNLEAPFQVAD